MIEIIIAEGTIETNVEGYLKLIHFYEKCNSFSKAQIIIAFEKLTWIDANMSALLMCIIDKLSKEKELTFFVDQDIIKTRFNILIRNGWLRGVDLIPNFNKTAIKLIGFDKSQDQKFVLYIHKELLSNTNLSISDPVKSELMASFFELFCNIEKHARTESPIFACGQYYPILRRLSFTMVDSGVGYLPPIKEFTGGKIQNSLDAINWALEGNNTTKRDAPGGLGLKMIQKFCQDTGSKFEIITGGVYWTNYKSMQTVKEFCGTVVNLIFEKT